MPDRIDRYRPPRFVTQLPTKEVAHYRTADWKAKRLRILVRDAYVCQADGCGRVVSGREAHVDHLVPLEEGGTDADTNLRTMCDVCHGRKTRGEMRRRGLA